MTTTAGSFYVTGGTMPPDAPSYVERGADRDLHESLTRGEFCYVLTARQMGKSSLMVRTAARLRQEGTGVAAIDLTALGRNLTPAQWYLGLLEQLGQQLGLEEEMENHWLSREDRSPLQRFLSALPDVALRHDRGRLVVFADEIDIVRSLPFSADEFFAAIRACSNRRAAEPVFARLTFCLLGVATPSQLIADTRSTPFNIGRRIELGDFTEQEAAPLVRGLDRPERLRKRLLGRILYWTGGHPYLTQRLLRAVAEDPAARRPADVDRLCRDLYLAPGSRERDDNLLFVRDRLLEGTPDRVGLLDLYARVQKCQRVPDEETDPLVSALKLSGIVRSQGGALTVRNRIYGRVFDRDWVLTHMPGAEVRRQKAAYRRGLLRAAGASSAFILLIGAVALSAIRSEHKARTALARARQAEKRERDQRLRTQHLLYGAQVNLAFQAWDAGNVGRAVELLKEQLPSPGREDGRGFEWYYLWRLCHSNLSTLEGHKHLIFSVAFSPDGTMAASGSFDGTAKLWDVAARREVATLRGHTGWVTCVAFSPDGRTLATGGDDKTVRLWDVATRREAALLRARVDRAALEAYRGLPKAIAAVAFSPDGTALATPGFDGTVRLWDVAVRREVGVFRGHVHQVNSIAFSPDGRTLATGSSDRSTRLWDVDTRRETALLPGHKGISAVAFSPDGRTLATGGDDRIVRLWDVATRQAAPLRGHTHNVNSVAFSPDGKTLASCSWDNSIRLWNVATRQAATLKAHTALVNCVAFSPDGRTLASGSNDRTVRLWNVAAAGRQAAALEGQTGLVTGLAFSPDGRSLATAHSHRHTKLWDRATRREAATLPALASSVAFSPDGRSIVTGGHDRMVRLWDRATRRQVAAFRTHSERINTVSFSPDSRTLVAGVDRTVRLWDRASRREIATLTEPGGTVCCTAFSPDGRILAAGSDDGRVRLWDVTTRRMRGPLEGHTNTVHSLAFSPDGATLATSSWDQTVKLWDVSTWREVATLKAHTGPVTAVAFSPDGRTLATGSEDTTVKLWNVATRQEMAVLKGHASPVLCVTFSPNGRTLAAGGMDTVKLWIADRSVAADAAQEAVGEDGRGGDDEHALDLQRHPRRDVPF